MLAYSQELAPVNPKFIKRLENLQSKRAIGKTGGSRPLGYSPAPVNLSHIARSAKGLKAASKTFAASYDLRSYGKVTAVKDQGNYGSCWAFATFGSLESCLLNDETDNFSENNLANLHGFDYDGFDDGGNAYMSTAYLTRWGGPVNESDDPYPNRGGSPSGLTVRKHVQNVEFIPERASATDNDDIKQTIVDHGALYTSFYWDDAYYQAGTASYYYNGAEDANHAVAVVGWDDNYSKANFASQPSGNGAFIIKNSWGTDWGKSGYGYISYYDSGIGLDNVIFLDAESTNNYGAIYQYDPLGLIGYCGYDATSAWGANIFTAGSPASLSAVGFYSITENTSYQIFVYTGVTAGQPRSGTLAASQSGALSAAGYHTIPLNTAVDLSANQRFSIVVKFTTPGCAYPLPVEYAYPGYSSAAAASAGQSFVSSDGASDWEDAVTFDSTMNICIKAYAAATTTAPNTSAEIEPNITINSQNSSQITLRQGSQLSVAISMSTSSSLEADWWVLADTPYGWFVWYFYSPSDCVWRFAASEASYQGPLFNLSPFEVLNMNTAELAVGTYVFYFGVDLLQNGRIDYDVLYYDYAALNLKK